MSIQGDFPDNIDPMKKHLRVEPAEFKRLVKVFRMLLGQKHSVKVEVRNSVIKQTLGTKGSFVHIDMSSWLNSYGLLNCKVTVTKEIARSINSISKNAEKIWIYKSDQEDIMFSDGHSRIYSNSFKHDLPSDPIDAVHAPIGNPIEIHWPTLNQYIEKSSNLSLTLYNYKVEIIAVHGKSKYIIDPDNFNDINKPQPQGILRTDDFFKLSPSKKNVTISIVTALNRPWLKIIWPLWPDPSAKRTHTIDGVTMHSLTE